MNRSTERETAEVNLRRLFLLSVFSTARSPTGHECGVAAQHEGCKGQGVLADEKQFFNDAQIAGHDFPRFVKPLVVGR